MAGGEKGLEEVLTEIGNRLLAPPSAVDELLTLLDQAETLLSRVEQSPSKSMSAALRPAMEGLTSKELLGHSDIDVKVAVASCISEITRITAPEAPYDDDLMKEIFEMIVESFEKLDDMQSRSYTKRVSILETVAKVRSCVVMLDLECDALILKMFHHFLKTIRDNHPGNVFSSMELIMTVVLEESEDISPGLLSCLLTSVKKDSKDTLQIVRRLAEKVIGHCASKLKPCLEEAVNSLGSSLSDFSDIVTFVCQADSDQLSHGGLSVSGECLADDSKLRTISDELPKVGKLESDVACSEAISNLAGKSPKSVTGNGAVQTEDGDTCAARVLSQEKTENSGLVTSARDTNSAVEIDKADTSSACTREQEPEGHINDSVTKTVETTGLSQINGDKEAAESLNRSKHTNEINSEAEVLVNTEANVSKTDTKTTEPQSTSPKDEPSAVQSVPSAKTPETIRPKRGRPPGSKNSLKKGGNVGKHVSPSTGTLLVKRRTKSDVTPSPEVHSKELGRPPGSKGSFKRRGSIGDHSKKGNEGISDLEPGQSVKKGSRRNVDNGENLSSEYPLSKMDLDVSSDSDGNHVGRLKSQREKAKEGKTSKKGQASKYKQHKEMRSLEDSTVSSDSNFKVKASSIKTDTIDVHDENHVAESPKLESRKKHAHEKTSEIKYDQSLVGAKIKVWWPEDKQFYAGVIDSYDPITNQHTVFYVDGDEETLLLKNEKFRFLKGDEEVGDEGDLIPMGASETPRKTAKALGSSSKRSKMFASSKGGRGSSTGKGIGSSGKSSSGGRGGRPRKRNDETPTESRTKEKTGAAMKSHEGKTKTIPKDGDDVAKKSSKDRKSATGSAAKSGSSTPKSEKPEANGSTKGKKRHRDEEGSSAGTAKEGEEKSGKKRRR